LASSSDSSCAERSEPLTVPFLSDAWRQLFLEEAAGLPGLAGASGTLEFVVSRQNGTSGVFTLRLSDGRVDAVSLGSPGVRPDLRVEMTQDDVITMFAGDTDNLYKAYWVGRMRATGDMMTTAAVAPLLDSGGFRGLLRRMLDRTDFS